MNALFRVRYLRNRTLPLLEKKRSGRFFAFIGTF